MNQLPQEDGGRPTPIEIHIDNTDIIMRDIGLFNSQPIGA